MSRRFFIPLFAALTMLFAFPRAARAEEPDHYLKDKQAELGGLLKKGKSAGNEKKIADLFDTLLDYDTLAKDSLGKHWGELKDDQKKDFQDVLKRLVRNAYRKNLKKTLKYEIKYRGVDDAKKGKLVRTVAKSRDNKREEAISIDYVMNKVDGKWRVQDIVTEGSSLVNNYKSQFGRVIKKKSFDELMSRMKKKLEKDGG